MVFNVLDFYTKQDFYEKPDGEALASKIVASTEIPLTTGIALTCGDILAANKNAFGLYTFQRFFQRFMPMQCMAFMFTVTTHAVARIRKKNDPYNHAIGALSAIPVVRMYHSFPTTLLVGTLLVIGAGICKSVADDPWLGRNVGFIEPRDGAMCWPAWSELKTPPTQFIKYD